jgi:hypothetical protein
MAPAQQRTTCTLRRPDHDLERADAVDPAFDSVAGRQQRRDSAGVPVMMMSPTPSETLLGQFGDDLRHAPDQLREVALLPLADAELSSRSCCGRVLVLHGQEWPPKSAELASEALLLRLEHDEMRL